MARAQRQPKDQACALLVDERQINDGLTGQVRLLALRLVFEASLAAPAMRLNLQDLAQILNISRETVSRGLQILIKNNIAIKSGHKLHIKDPELLSLLASKGIDALRATTQSNLESN